MIEKTKAILIGHILGDGFLYPNSKKGASQLESKYSDKSFEYLLWLHQNLAELNPRDIKLHQNNQHLFHTKPSIEVGKLRTLFYPKCEDSSS